MTPENRTKYLLQAFGFQGGTIHQLAEITGCSAQILLYKDFSDNEWDLEYQGGFFWDTNTKEYQDNHIIPSRKGNLYYWFGVMRKMEILEVNCGIVYNRHSQDALEIKECFNI